MLQCIDTTDVFIMPMQSFLKFWSVSNPRRDIWDHLWIRCSSYFGQPKFADSFILTNRFIVAVLLLTYVGNLEKE